MKDEKEREDRALEAETVGEIGKLTFAQRKAQIIHTKGTSRTRGKVGSAGINKIQMGRSV